MTITASAGSPAAVKVANPRFYSSASANVEWVTYKLPAVVSDTGAKKAEYLLTLQTESGKTYASHGVVTTWYTAEAFQDVNGAFVEGIEDSDGTAKHEDTWEEAFHVQLSA